MLGSMQQASVLSEKCLICDITVTHTSISFLVTKSLCQCDSDDSENIYVVVIVTFSETDR